MLSFLHAAVTRWRRAHVEPRRLARPVISIGNIAVGGRAKTPMAALVARALLDAGERPAILSRGYARARPVDTPVVVRDAGGVRASLKASGDEPLMLAEALEGAIVVVGADRARAGMVAEQLGATVHILDDGFQHLRVARDVDIVMMEPRDLADDVMPAGRLREPLDALGQADAIVMCDDSAEQREKAAEALRGIPGITMFTASRRVLPPPADLAAARALLVSGLADNAQFSWSAGEAGWRIAGHATFKDHHAYSAEDAARVARDAAAAGADVVLTTAKDAVRLREVWPPSPEATAGQGPHAPEATAGQGRVMPLHIAEMTLEIDQADDFARWLIGRVTQARTDRAEAELRALRRGPRRAS